MTESTKKQRILFYIKSRLLVLARTARDFGSMKAHDCRAGKPGPWIAGSQSALWSGIAQEKPMELGKVENLRRAIVSIDGIYVPAGGCFSFWRQVGPPWRIRGYVKGRELRMGCIIPAIGGGLCQLSNALYDCALQAGFEIVERHAHSAAVPHSGTAPGRDATVFWNYVDLRFRSTRDYTIKISMDADRLRVSFHAVSP